MIVNASLLQRTMEQIEAHPQDWKQSVWIEKPEGGVRCGTVGCFAGWAVALSGGEFWFGPNGEWNSAESVLLDSLPGDIRESLEVWAYRESDGDGGHVVVVDLPRTARELLGVDPYRADRLFNGSNRLSDLRRLVADYIAEAVAA
jgi:hypothetical protein